MPRTPRQSARFGVTLMSSTGSSSPSQLGERRADRRVRRQVDDAVVILAQAQLARRAQHAVRFDAADRASP